MSELSADLVFEGGGVKGIGLAGAYRELFDRGYVPQCVAGTSAGAITAALVAVGYTGAELEQVVLHEMRFQDFEDRTFIQRAGPAGDLIEFMRTRGLHSGDYFLGWMRARLQDKGITKFGQLRDPAAGADDPRLYRLQVIASDLSGRSMLVLPRDARTLGIDPDELEIADAVRMSMSIPVFFEPVLRRDPAGVEHTIVDGGLLSNFPIWLFDCQNGPPSFPTFGMLLVAPGQKAPLVPGGDVAASASPIGSDLDFVKAMAETMMEAHDRFYVDQANYARTIPINTLGVKTTEFDLTPERAQSLFQSGRDAAHEFLAHWDFDAYVARYRSGRGVSRRSQV